MGGVADVPQSEMRLPPPQVWAGSPGQATLQSVEKEGKEPWEREFPQVLLMVSC